MTEPQLVWAGEEATRFDRAHVGGKGLNLLRLHSFSQQTGRVTVPNFFIIPTIYPYVSYGGAKNCLYFEDNDRVRYAFEKLGKPVIARSSSPAEDGLNASFAGMFSSFAGQTSYEEFCSTLNQIRLSAFNNQVKRYAEKMGVDYESRMAFIAQEQVTDFLHKGVIQLEEGKAIVEFTTREGDKHSGETDYKLLDEGGPWGVFEKPHDWIGDREEHNAVQCARDAAKSLGLEGIVQVEYLLKPAAKPYFVQIRQLPRIISHAVSLNMDIPRDTPYIESEVCNGVSGELVLPAYVTVSQGGFGELSFNYGFNECGETMQTFLERSKLAHSIDFNTAMNLEAKLSELPSMLISEFEAMWERGNSLFPEYILVCDKLDETVAGMSRSTTNKKAIITCLEAQRTSHAMTVARELGIPAMGVRGKIKNMDYFFNQVETGDIVHLKSDGKRAVAYIKKTREKDPYYIEG